MRSLDGERVQRRADRTGKRERRTYEHELVYAVLLAIGGQGLEIEDLPDQHAGIDNDDHMQGLEYVVGLVWTHFHTPGVGCDARHFGLTQPLGARQVDARGI